MLKPLTRASALRAYTDARDAKLDFTAEPIEAGMGRCPWRISIAVIVNRNINTSLVGEKLAIVFIEWPTPERMADAAPSDIAERMEGLRLNYNRAERMVQFSRAWTRDDWKTLIDLPGFSRASLIAIDKYVPLSWQ